MVSKITVHTWAAMPESAMKDVGSRDAPSSKAVVIDKDFGDALPVFNQIS